MSLFKLIACAVLLAAISCTPAPPVSAKAKESSKDIFELSPTADPPRWDQLDAYQGSFTAEEFLEILRQVYSEGESYKTSIKIYPDHADIRRSSKGAQSLVYRLDFAPTVDERVPPQSEPFWRPASALPKSPPPGKPLEGLRIAIDAGHIGGEWARMEERWFQIGEDPPVKEGELSLRVARILQPMLEDLGAKVTLVRRKLKPVTRKRPRHFEALAEEGLAKAGFPSPVRSYQDLPFGSSKKRFTVQWQSEVLFYRAREIRDRARLVNHKIKPDLVICIHFNAEAWGDPENPTLVDKNHFHVLFNGTYSLAELNLDDVRFEMLRRLLQRTHLEEIPLCSAIADSMAEITGLPPYVYPGRNAQRVNDNPHVYARNLLANRTYLCPVAFLEPYVMNNEEVYRRIQNAGSESPNIFQEYARGIAGGLAEYYSAQRATAAPSSEEQPVTTDH